MKPTELRIGNQFQEKHTGEIIEVIGLTAEKIMFSGVFENEWQAEPIKVQKDVLEKFGFKEFGSSDRMHYSNGEKSILLNYAECRDVWHWQGIDLMFFHELQNLYFTLQKQELLK